MAEVLALFTHQQLATALGIKYSSAAALNQRGWVHAAHWVPLVAAVTARDRVLTYEMLSQWAHSRGPKVSATAPAAPRARRHASSAAPTGPPP